MARTLDNSGPAAARGATGARLFRGEGKLTDLRTVEFLGEQLVARRAVVIANGSTAVIPPIPGLDTVEFWTNRQAAIPREMPARSEEHTSELQSLAYLVCRLLLEKKNCYFSAAARSFCRCSRATSY